MSNCCPSDVEAVQNLEFRILRNNLVLGLLIEFLWLKFSGEKEKNPKAQIGEVCINRSRAIKNIH